MFVAVMKMSGASMTKSKIIPAVFCFTVKSFRSTAADLNMPFHFSHYVLLPV